MTGTAPAPSRSEQETGLPVNWIGFGWICALIAICYAPVLRSLFHQWHANEDMGHGLFVPFFALYVIWERRFAICSAAAASPPQGHVAGLALMVAAMLQFVIGLLAAELFLQRTAFVASVAGVVLYFGGMRVFRLTAFPLFLMLFSIPVPGIALKSITFPLQLLSSQMAEFALEAGGYNVLRDGNILELAGQQLSVAEACSGIRAILSLSFFSICYGYLCESRMWVRALLAVATIPFAVVANAGRVVLIGAIADIDAELAAGFLHTASGWVIFVVSVVMLLLLHRLTTAVWPDASEEAAL